MKKVFFIFILFLAVVLRFYKLGALPSGLTWDEAAIGYSAYGIATTFRDEWLKRLPITFQSFGDYKSPLLVYTLAIFLKVFPPTSFTIRLPIVLAGVGLVILSFLLTKEVMARTRRKDKTIVSDFVPYFVMFLVAISPWAIQFSRVAFESMLATFLVAVGVYCWLRGMRAFEDKENKPHPGVYWVIGDISMVLAMYAYHSAKVVVPLLVLIFLLRFFSIFWKHKKWAIAGTIVALLVALPLLHATLFGKANERAKSTTILSSDQPVTKFIQNYVRHLEPGYYLIGSEFTYRHSTQQMGILYPVELALAVAGIVLIVRNTPWRIHWWILAIYAVSIIPAALGNEVPHANRALMGIPWIHLLAGLGFLGVVQTIFTKYPRLLQPFMILLVVSLLANLVLFTRVYLSTYTSKEALEEFGYGYEELLSYLISQEKTTSNIYITDHYQQVYIYLLFFKRLTPFEYQYGGLNHYIIGNDPYARAQGKENVLIVGTPDEIPEDKKTVREIRYPDGHIRLNVIQQ